MQFGRFRLGMRTMKSALAVFLCILIFHLFDRGIPMIAAYLLFFLAPGFDYDLFFGRSRIIGNLLGGGLGIFYFFVKSSFHNDFLVELIVLPLLVIIVIVLSDGINNNSGIIAAIATLLLISLSIPQGESAFYAIERVFDTFIGTFIAIGINFCLRPPEVEKKEEIVEDLEQLRKKEQALLESLEEVKAQIREQNENK